MLLLLNPMSDLSALHLTYKCPSNTILPQIMARVFISFQQHFTPATKRDWRLYRDWRLLVEVLNQSISGYEF